MKGVSISFLLVYLGIIYMPYAPYVYFHATTDNCATGQIITAKASFNSEMPLLGDICYLEAIKKRTENKVPDNTKELPDLIVQNNMEYVSAYTVTTCITHVKKDCDYIEYSSVIKDLIQEVDSPPPKKS